MGGGEGMAARRDDARRNVTDPARWAKVKEVFLAARECEPEGRASFVRERCGGDEALRGAVEAMLSRESDADAFLESPALQVEARALANDPHGGRTASGGLGPTAPPASVEARPAHHRWWILALAAVFLADLLLKTWGFLLGPAGFGIRTRVERGDQVIAQITPGSPADLAGMLVGDVLLSVGGRPAVPMSDGPSARANLEIGRVYGFEFLRGAQRLEASITMPRTDPPRRVGQAVAALWLVAAFALLATGILIATVRPGDPVALSGALTLASLSVGLWVYNLAPGYAVAWRRAPLGLGTLLWIPNICVALMGPIGFSFFALFPRPLVRDWRIWGVIWLPALLLLPGQLHRIFVFVYRPDDVQGRTPSWLPLVIVGMFAVYGFAMLVAVAINYARLTDPNERRRLWLLAAGGAAGTLPGLFRLLVMGVAPTSAAYDFLMNTVSVDVFIVLIFLLFPASFAYSVLKHRLLDVRVIIRMGLKYALARGVVLALVPLIAFVLVADALVHGDQPLIRILGQRGWIYAVLAALAVAAYTQRQRWSVAIDRRYFREQYVASRLLREVAEQARRAGSFERAAPAVVARVEAALHPDFAALMFRSFDEASFRCVASSPIGQVPPPVDAYGPLAKRLRAVEKPIALTGSDAGRAGEWASGLEPEELRTARVEWLLPIAMGSGRHEAILALGRKRSEEPYTPDDLAALEAIAFNLALLAEGSTPRPDRATETFGECPECGGCHDTGTARCPDGHAPLVAVGMPRTLGGRYRLDRRLGRGGMGTVYEALDVALDRRVAVKVVRDEWVHNSFATQRFRREARAVAGFSHPNVVTVYDYGVETGSRVFLVMELLHGTTLRGELQRSGRLSPARTLEVLRGVSSAVEAAHRHGFIHRDLKPENIFLIERGGPVKVLDFGVVKPLLPMEAAAPGEPPETEVGVLVGTVGYMSPEQLLGDSPDVSWDVWALTVVAYEALTAALPFPVGSREAWRQLVLSGRFRPLADHLDDAPAQWQTFFDTSFAVDRRVRPHTAADFCRQLERALA
jgi:tRNA A-37 threonylcarbamoyl transferase component Bud32